MDGAGDKVGVTVAFPSRSCCVDDDDPHRRNFGLSIRSLLDATAKADDATDRRRHCVQESFILQISEVYWGLAAGCTVAQGGRRGKRRQTMTKGKKGGSLVSLSCAIDRLRSKPRVFALNQSCMTQGMQVCMNGTTLPENLILC
jgi:hypothetical protein